MDILYLILSSSQSLSSFKLNFQKLSSLLDPLEKVGFIYILYFLQI